MKLADGEIEVPTLTKTLTNFNIGSGTSCSFIGCAKLPGGTTCRVSETPSCTYTSTESSETNILIDYMSLSLLFCKENTASFNFRGTISMKFQRLIQTRLFTGSIPIAFVYLHDYYRQSFV